MTFGTPARRRRSDCLECDFRRMRPAEALEHMRGQRLDSDRNPIEPADQATLERPLVHRLGVGLDRDLGIRREPEARRNRRQDPTQADPARATSACRHRRRPTLQRGRSPPLPAPSLDVGDERVDVALVQLVQALVGVEVAVVAPVQAERDVHVDAEAGIGLPRDRRMLAGVVRDRTATSSFLRLSDESISKRLDERRLRNLDLRRSASSGACPLSAFEKFSLPRDVTAVALGDDVFALGPHRLSGDDA